MQTSLTVSLPHRARRGREPLHTWHAWGLRLLVLAAAVGAGLYARQQLIIDSAHPCNRVQRIALVNAQRTVPPKEDKPKEAPPKEREVQKPQVDLNDPAEAAPPDEKPHDDQLGVDAEGGTGTALRDAFALLTLLPEPPRGLPPSLRLRGTARGLASQRRQWRRPVMCSSLKGSPWASR